MSAGTNRRLSRDSEHHRQALTSPFDVGPLHGLLPSFSELIASAPIHHHHHSRPSGHQPPARQRSQTDAVPDSDPDTDTLPDRTHPFLLVPAGGSRLRVIVHVTPHTAAITSTPNPTSAASAASAVFTPNSPANMPPTHSPPSSGSHGQDHAEDTRRVKRRKLDSDKLSSNGSRGFRYGKYGQVEPGVLKMEMSSCDPGTNHRGMSHVPENMLNNYASIYCARGSRCNIVLKHQGESVFNLKELVVKTPRALEFASPARDGIVFVAMGLNELLTRTAQYKIQYVPSTTNTQPDEFDGLSDPGNEALGLLPRTQRPPPEHVPPTWRTHVRQRRLNSMFDDADDSDELPEIKVAAMPDEFIKTSSAVRATSQCDIDRELDDVEPYLQNAPPIGQPSQTPRIGSLPFETDNNEDPDGFGPEDYLSPAIRGVTQRPVTTFGDSFETTTTHRASADEQTRGNSPTQLMQPVANFHIGRKFNKCTICFDPPVAGRYILLKMWNAQPWSASIAIQSVTAKGYAGSRYIPSIQWR